MAKPIYTEMNSRFGFWQEGGPNFCVWSERPLPNGKARVKTKNLVPSRRGQKPNLEFISV
jgi:hypothetical protein